MAATPRQAPTRQSLAVLAAATAATMLVVACGGGPSASSGWTSGPGRTPTASVPATAAPSPSSEASASPAPSRSAPASPAIAPSSFVLVAAEVAVGQARLVIAQPDGARVQVPVSGMAYSEVAVRPGTDEVVLPMTFCEVADQPCGTILVAVDLVTHVERRLTDFAPGASDVMPAWSPDGSRLAFASSRRGDPFGQELYVIPAEGGKPVMVDTGLRLSQSPAWSPDGTAVAFVGMDDQGASGVYVVDAGGGQPRRLVPLDGSSSLSWSPDGSRIAYEATNVVETAPGQAVGYGAIAVVDVATGASEVILATPSGNRRPAWSPDGSTIAFIRQEDGMSGRLALVDADGSDVRILGTEAWDDQAFAWLP